MEICLESIESIEEISQKEFDVLNINSIKEGHGALRSKSKAPT